MPRRRLPCVAVNQLPIPYTMLFHSLHPPDSCRQIGTEQPTIGSLVRKAADSRQAEVDSGRCIITLFEADAVSSNDGFVESEARFRAVPVDEFADRVIIRSLRTPRGQTIQDCGFRLFEIRHLQDSFRIAFTFVLGHSSSLRRQVALAIARISRRTLG